MVTAGVYTWFCAKAAAGMKGHGRCLKKDRVTVADVDSSCFFDCAVGIATSFASGK